jgi:hypothetical protein
MNEMVEDKVGIIEDIDEGILSEETINPRLVSIIMSIAALFAPFIIQMYEHPSGEGFVIFVSAFIWAVDMNPITGVQIIPLPLIPISYLFNPVYYTVVLFSVFVILIYFAPRFAYVYMTTRYYERKTTKIRALLSGIFADSIVLFFAFPFIITTLFAPHSFTSIGFPTPVLLLIGFLIYKIKPPPVVLAPWKQSIETENKWE